MHLSWDGKYIVQWDDAEIFHLNLFCSLVIRRRRIYQGYLSTSTNTNQTTSFAVYATNFFNANILFSYFLAGHACMHMFVQLVRFTIHISVTLFVVTWQDFWNCYL